MSSLIFYTDESQALIATDTLATYADGRPFLFTTKAFIVPHLRAIIAGTGAGGFLGKWFVRVNDRMLLRGLEHLNHHAPAILPNIWTEFQREFSIKDVSTTVYHFGFSEVTGRIRSYAYRSTDGFRSEEIAYGLGRKPECDVPDNYQLPDDIKKMMDDQRAIQASKPKEERLYIGGEIVVHYLSKGGFNTYTLHRFDDYLADEIAMYENFRSPEQNS